MSEQGIVFVQASQDVIDLIYDEQQTSTQPYKPSEQEDEEEVIYMGEMKSPKPPRRAHQPQPSAPKPPSKPTSRRRRRRDRIADPTKRARLLYLNRRFHAVKYATLEWDRYIKLYNQLMWPHTVHTDPEHAVRPVRKAHRNKVVTQ
jgi:hypothetical protein